MVKNLILGPRNFFRGFYLFQMLDIVANYHCIQFQGNRIIQTQWWKTSFWAWFRPIGPKFGLPFFLKKNQASSYHGQLLSCTIPEKTNDPISRKLSDRWADRHKDESGFIGSCLTNVERPKTSSLGKKAKFIKFPYLFIMLQSFSVYLLKPKKGSFDSCSQKIDSFLNKSMKPNTIKWEFLQQKINCLWKGYIESNFCSFRFLNQWREKHITTVDE